MAQNDLNINHFSLQYLAMESRYIAESHLPTHHGPPAASADHLSAMSH